MGRKFSINGRDSCVGFIVAQLPQQTNQCSVFYVVLHVDNADDYYPIGATKVYNIPEYPQHSSIEHKQGKYLI